MIQVEYLSKKKKRTHAKYACMRHPAGGLSFLPRSACATVTAALSATLSATPPLIDPGNSSSLSWTTNQPTNNNITLTQVSISDTSFNPVCGVTGVPPCVQPYAVSPAGTTNYTLTVAGTTDGNPDSFTTSPPTPVTVNPPWVKITAPDPATFSFVATNINGIEQNVSSRSILRTIGINNPIPLTASTNVANGTVNWNVVGDQPSHSGNPSTPNPGLTSSFVPTPTHPAYSSANAHSPTLTYAYTVTATVAGVSNPSPLFVIVQINLADRLIQEYVNHFSLLDAGTSKTLFFANIPNQLMLAPVICSQHFCKTFGDILNGEDGNLGAYGIIVNGAMTSVAEQVLTNYNNLINDPSTQYFLHISSGYRNPEYNEQIGSVITSFHQFGRALDLNTSTYPLPPQLSVSDAIRLIQRAADAVGSVSNTQCELRNEIVACAGTLDHIHVEFSLQ